MKLSLTQTFVLLGAMLMPGIASAQNTYEGFTFTVSGSNATITKAPTTGAVYIPDQVESGGKTYTVTTLSASLFKNSDITSLSIPATVTKTGASLCEGCSKLVKFEGRYTGTGSTAKGLQTVDQKAFLNCTALLSDSLLLPPTAYWYSANCFENCTSLTYFQCPEYYSSSFVFGTKMFQGCTKLVKLILNTKMTSFNPSATILAGSNFEEFEVPAANTKLCSVDGVVYDKAVKKLLSYPTHKKSADFTMPATVTTCTFAFKGIQYLVNYKDNDMRTSLTANSFQACPMLETAWFGKKLATFPGGCFTKSDKMKSVSISDENPNLKVEQGGVLSKDNKTLYVRFPFTPGTEYIAPEGLEYISASALAYNDKLEKIVLSKSLVTIQSTAFGYCTALKSIVIPEKVKQLPVNCFRNCSELVDVTLPDSLTVLGDQAFYYCKKLSSITLPKLLTTIGDDVFAQAAFVKVTVPDSVTAIGEGAFRDIDNLAEITIGKSVKTIGPSAFNTNSMSDAKYTVTIYATVPPAIGTATYSESFDKNAKIYVPAEAVDAYKANASYKIYQIYAIAPKTVQNVTTTAAGTLKDKIAADLVNGVVGLTVSGPINGADFDFINTMGQITRLDLTKATIEKGSSDSISTEANVFPKRALYNLARLDSLIMPESVVEIADSACMKKSDWDYENKVLKHITLPTELKKIGSDAFYYLSGLKEIKLPNKLEVIGDFAFGQCSGLTKIELPASVDSIREGAFNGCRGVTEMKLNDGLKFIGDRALAMMSKLESMVVPESVDSMGSSVFQMNKAMKTIKFSPNVKMLRIYTCWCCESLEEVEIPDGVERLGQSCFASCNKLKKVKLPETLTRLDNSVFVLDSVLERVDIPRYINYLGSNICERNINLKLATVAYDWALPGEPALPPVDESKLPERLTGGTGMFMNCTKLEALYLGSTFTGLNENFLTNCPSLKKLYVAAPLPPGSYTGDVVFTNYDATLYVPKNSIPIYKNNAVWGKFKEILAIEDNLSGLDNLFDDANEADVRVENGVIVFSDPKATVSVGTFAGQCLYQGKAKNLELGAGLYLVIVKGKGYKLLVK